MEEPRATRSEINESRLATNKKRTTTTSVAHRYYENSTPMFQLAPKQNC